MPEERDIEKSLRAWAKTRREDAGAPVELDPTTRQLLQAEVSRLKGGARQPPGLLARLLWGSPVRLALNLTVAALVVAAGALFLPQFRHSPSPSAAPATLLAQADRKLVTASEPAGATAKDELNAPQPASPPPLDASKKTTGQNIPATNGAIALAYNRSMIEAPASQSTSTPQQLALAQSPVFVQDKLMATNAAVYSLNDSASVMTRSLDSAVIAQKFSRLPAQTEVSNSEKLAVAKTGPAAVLISFRMEQTGGQLRVIDNDGSVYTGSLVAQDQPLKSDAAASSAPSRSFRVSGTNLTRNQLLVFTGSLVFDDQSSQQIQTDSGNLAGVRPAPGAAVGGGVGGGGGGGFGAAAAGTFKFARQTNLASAPPVAAPAVVTAAGAGGPMPLLNFRIQGRALIGTNEIQINAVPTQP